MVTIEIGGATLHINPTNDTQLFMEGVDWHELVGKRVCCIREGVLRPEADYRLITLSLLVQVKEVMSTWLMTTTATPRIYDLMWPERSKATVAQQFISQLLAGSRAVVL